MPHECIMAASCEFAIKNNNKMLLNTDRSGFNESSREKHSQLSFIFSTTSTTDTLYAGPTSKKQETVLNVIVKRLKIALIKDVTVQMEATKVKVSQKNKQLYLFSILIHQRHDLNVY